MGVDGGNTKTTAVVLDVLSGVVGVGDGGCSDIYGVSSPSLALVELDRVVESALKSSGLGFDKLSAAVFSLAGADWPEDHAFLHQYLKRWCCGFEPIVVNDSMGGLRLGSPCWEGIAVICGTGNAVGARKHDGACFHLGFWPDTVGSTSLSQAALDAVLRDHLGLGPPTSLTVRTQELYGASDPIELQHCFTRRGGHGQRELVRMSPVLLDEADAGDEVALQIVSGAGQTMGAQGRVSAERIELDVVGTVTVMGGGLFKHPSSVLADAVMSQLSGTLAVRTTLPPVVGAVLLALDQLDELSNAEAVACSLQEYQAG